MADVLTALKTGDLEVGSWPCCKGGGVGNLQAHGGPVRRAVVKVWVAPAQLLPMSLVELHVAAWALRQETRAGATPTMLCILAGTTKT